MNKAFSILLGLTISLTSLPVKAQSLNERLETYITQSMVFTDKIREQTEKFMTENNFGDLDLTENQELLRLCLKQTGYKMVDVPIYAEKGEDYALSSLGERTFCAWQDKAMTLNCFNAASEEHQLVIYTQDGIESAKAIANAVQYIPLPIRNRLKSLIYYNDSADSFNGGSGTIWIRKNALPSFNELVGSLFHEMGHILDEELTVEPAIWTEAILDDIVPVSSYGNDSRQEDLAEFARLYFSLRNDENSYNAVKKIYPNRTRAFEALLYHADNEAYKDFFDAARDLDVFSDTKRCTIKNKDGLALTYDGAKLILGKYLARQNQIWELRQLKRGGMVLVNAKHQICIGALRTGLTLTFESPTGAKNQIWVIENGSLLRHQYSEMYLNSTNLSSEKEEWRLTYLR